MYEANFLQIDSCWRSLNPLTWTEHKRQWMKNWILMCFFYQKWDFFRKLCWLYRFFKKMYGSLKKCTDWFKKMYGLYGFFFKKLYGLYGLFFENCTDCTDFFWKCTDFCTDGFKKVLATLNVLQRYTRSKPL